MFGKYKKILVPFDGSNQSKKAFEESLTISKIHNSKLYLLMAIPEPTVTNLGTFYSYGKGLGIHVDTKNLTNNTRERAEAFLQRQAFEAKKEGINADYEIITGDPKLAILDFAKRKKIDLIIMGTEGLGGIKKIKAIGSVSRTVAENSSCPIMLIH